MQIFWPVGECKPGFVFGWTDSDTTVVAGVLHFESISQAKLTLQRLRKTYGPANQQASIPPTLLLLGECLGGTTDNIIEGALPEIAWEFAPANQKLHYILYRRPEVNSMRFYSLEPLDLDITSTREYSKRFGPGRVEQRTRLVYQQRILEQGLLSRKLRLGLSSDTITKMNSAAYSLNKLSHRPSPSFTNSTSILRYAMALKGPRITRLQKHLKSVSTHLFKVCNMPTDPTSSSKTVTKDIFAAVQQIDLRLEQTNCLIQQAHVLANPVPEGANALLSAQYTSFFNCIWLISNDIIIGSTFGAFLCENHQLLGRLLYSQCKRSTVQFIYAALLWFDDWPAGLKLNTELSGFYRLTFTALAGVGECVIDRLAVYLPAIIYAIGTAGPLGMTMVISLLSDLLSIMTVHLYVSYLIVTMVFRHQISIATSLFNLFRGKRWNVLRNRTDSWDYEIDQLLLGTILFTLVTFLFPTVLVYYSVFALSRLVVILIHASLETVLAFMNHFPLFALMLRLKDPWRLPGGVVFRSLSNKATTFPLILTNTPIPFSNIFFQYSIQVLLWSRLSAHYSPLRLVHCIVSGVYLTPIPRYSIRYTMSSTLPASD